GRLPVPRSTRSAYTTLFRSRVGEDARLAHDGGALGGVQRHPDHLDLEERGVGIGGVAHAAGQLVPGTHAARPRHVDVERARVARDRKSTRLNSSHVKSSYAV